MQISCRRCPIVLHKQTNQTRFPCWGPLLIVLPGFRYLWTLTTTIHCLGPLRPQPRLHCLFGADSTCQNQELLRVTARRCCKRVTRSWSASRTLSSRYVPQPSFQATNKANAKGGGFFLPATRPAFFGLLGIVCRRHLSGSHLRVPRNDICHGRHLHSA